MKSGGQDLCLTGLEKKDLLGKKPYAVLNLHAFLSSVDHTNYFEECW